LLSGDGKITDRKLLSGDGKIIAAGEL